MIFIMKILYHFEYQRWTFYYFLPSGTKKKKKKKILKNLYNTLNSNLG